MIACFYVQDQRTAGAQIGVLGLCFRQETLSLDDTFAEDVQQLMHDREFDVAAGFKYSNWFQPQSAPPRIVNSSHSLNSPGTTLVTSGRGLKDFPSIAISMDRFAA